MRNRVNARATVSKERRCCSDKERERKREKKRFHNYANIFAREKKQTKKYIAKRNCT